MRGKVSVKNELKALGVSFEAASLTEAGISSLIERQRQVFRKGRVSETNVERVKEVRF